MTGHTLLIALAISGAFLVLAGLAWSLLRGSTPPITGAHSEMRPATRRRPGHDDQFGTWTPLRIPETASPSTPDTTGEAP